MLIDANLLLYAKIKDYPQHLAAKEWLESCLNGKHMVGIPWPNLLAFVRISTHAKLFEQPLALSQAWQQVESWLDIPIVWIPAPTICHREILKKLLHAVSASANLVQDAHLAALAVEHHLVLYSADRDFARFPDLDWENPLK